ncbi:MAG: CRISPR-associated ring nuclease Crn3/Csx3 [Spirulina sp.]
MTAVQFHLIPHQTECGLSYQHLHFELATPNGIIKPEDLKGLKLPKAIDYSQGIVLEGKGPIWLYGYLVHECHPAAWTGCYDPRLGAVVIATHAPDIQVSQIFKVTLPDEVLSRD